MFHTNVRAPFILTQEAVKIIRRENIGGSIVNIISDTSHGGPPYLQDEINAAMLTDPERVKLSHSQVTDARVEGDTERHIRTLLTMGPKVVIAKCGREGCRIHQADHGCSISMPTYQEVTEFVDSRGGL